MKQPHFTVLVPIYNTPGAHLIEAVHSLVDQDYIGPYQIILIDDGSTNPETIATIDKIVGHSTPTRTITKIRLEENQGTPVALNEGHRWVTTDYVAIHGSSDIAHHTKFRLQMAYLAKHPDTDVLGTNLFSFYDGDPNKSAIYTSNHIEEPMLRNSDNRYWVVNHGTVMYRQTAVMAVGGYNPALRRAQDVELWKRMWLAGYKFRNIEAVLYGWRKQKP